VVKLTEWWLVLLGLTFVGVTLFFPKGVGGLFDLISNYREKRE
jgi:urea transport system permease protein